MNRRWAESEPNPSRLCSPSPASEPYGVITVGKDLVAFVVLVLWDKCCGSIEYSSRWFIIKADRSYLDLAVCELSQKHLGKCALISSGRGVHPRLSRCAEAQRLHIKCIWTQGQRYSSFRRPLTAP